MPNIKVLIVDDSIFMRKLISSFIEKETDMIVAGMAKNGLEAVKMAEQLKPDVITLDVEMPEMDGLTALRYIMQKSPVPTLMVSSLTEKGAYETIKALQLGAVDFIQKPSGSVSMDLYRVKGELLDKIRAVAGAKLAKHTPIARTERKPVRSPEPVLQRQAPPVAEGPSTFGQIFVIGTSTGGPKALEKVLTALPADFKDPIVVVQHMPPKFTEHLAKRLDGISNVHVLEAKDQQPLRGGTVYIAPGDFHMEVCRRGSEYRIRLHQEEQRNGHRPSVEVLYDSVTKLPSLRKHYIIMTGMGRDGAEAMKRAKQKGAVTTIAESEETCIVYGMPKVAISLGCVDHILPLERISAKMVSLSQMKG